jgi:hypothetical protein
MAVMITLAAIALAVVPDVLNQDRTTDAASTVRQWLTTAKARASRDKAPRGVRFLFGGNDPTTPSQTNPLYVTELQYTEALPYLQLNDSKTQFGGAVLVFSCAYGVAGSTTPPTAGAMIFGQVKGNSATAPIMVAGTSPDCTITNLAATDAQALVNDGLGALLSVSPLGTTHRVTDVPVVKAQANPPGSFSATLTLDSFPQAELGAAGTATPAGRVPGLQQVFQTSLFAISSAPQPLVGEPTLQLPKNICVDMISSQSGALANASPNAPGIDIMFLPSGQLMPTWVTVSNGQPPQPVGATSQMFLWVRDYTKNGGLAFNNGVPAPDIVNFQQGGEQQVVSVKTKSGALGVFPVMWPNPSAFPVPPNTYLGYANGTDWFSFARQGSTSP